MILEGPYGPFCSIASMKVGRDKLKFDLCGGERLFHLEGALVVQDVDCWLLSMILKEVEYFVPGFCDVCSMARLDGDRMDTICIIVVQYEDVLITRDGFYRELACLI